MSQWDEWLITRADLRHQSGTERSDSVLRQENSIDLASNDYLGLARDQRVVAAAIAALREYGASAGASRLVTGTLAVHHELESVLCRLTEQPAALTFSSGYAANLGAVTALTGRGAHILLDAHAHASLHDAARMSRTAYDTFPHNDTAALDRRLGELAGLRVLVAVESIYSVLGDAAPLLTLTKVCRRHDALLLVDEAHSLGVVGDGRGLVHALNLVDEDAVVVTITLSKSLGSQGGAVLSTPAVREHLVNSARTLIFDTGLAPAAAAAARGTAGIVLAEPDLATAVTERTTIIARTLQIERAAGAVQSVPMPNPNAAITAQNALRCEGILVGCFRPPSVPDGISRLRITARADLPLAAVTTAAERIAAVVMVTT